MIYLYDPINNVKTPTTYEIIAGMTGYSIKSLPSRKSRRKKLKIINSYIIDDKFTKKELREFMEAENPKDELWKDAPGTDHKYEISSYGRLRNKRTKYLITPCLNSKQMIGSTLLINGKKKYVKFSQLVAEAFLYRPDNCDSVIHKGSKFNNHVDNLKWVTWKESLKFNGKSNERAKAVYKLDISTYEIIDEYDGIRQASRENYIDRKGLSVAVHDITKSSAGFRWCLVARYNEVMKEVGINV